MSNLVLAEEEVLEGIVVEHEGLPFIEPIRFVNHWWGVDPATPPTSTHFIIDGDTIKQVVYPEQEWK